MRVPTSPRLRWRDRWERGRPAGARPARLPISLLLGLVLTGLTSGASTGAPPETWSNVRSCGHMGGDFTSVVKAEHGLRTVILKSNRPRNQVDPGPDGPSRARQLTRWSNFEADLLATRLFALAGLRVPAVEVVRLDPSGSGAALVREIGSPALAMDFVDAAWARTAVERGRWPGLESADADGFIALALVDILAGNADRSDDNFFISRGPSGRWTPVPIDNNAGFATSLIWTEPNGLVNFVPSYDWPGASVECRGAGSIQNIVVREGRYPMVHKNLFLALPLKPRVLAAARALADRLTPVLIDRMVASLPSEVIPSDVVVATPAGPLAGRALFSARCAEIRRILAWRAEHLVAALERLYRQLEE